MYHRALEREDTTESESSVSSVDILLEMNIDGNLTTKK